MSENNTNPELKPNLPAATIVENGETKQCDYQFEGAGPDALVYVEPTPGVRIYIDTFGGALAGLSYHYVQFEHENPATSIELALGKYGPEKVLNLINTGLKNFTTAKVRNSKVKALDVLKEDGTLDEEATAKAIANVRANNPLLFSAQEALDYSPMQREETVASLLKKANKAAKEQRLDDFMALMEKAQQQMLAKKALQDASR